MASAPDFSRRRALLSALGLALLSQAPLGLPRVLLAADGPTVAPGTEALAGERARLEALAAVYAAFYRRPPEVPARLLRLGLSPDDVSVVLFLAERGSADPHAIATARMTSKAPWHSLMRAYGVRQSALAVRLDRARPTSGPYARAYRVLAGRARGPLTDAEVRDLVQLRLVTRHFGLRPSRVLARRTAGTRATDLVLELDRARGGTAADAPRRGRS